MKEIGKPVRVALVLLSLLHGGIALRDVANADTLSTTADAYVAAFDESTSFGLELDLQIKNNTGSPVFFRKCYMAFEAPDCGEFSTVTLELEQAEGFGEDAIGLQVFSVYGLNTPETWVETSITWVNAPENVVGSGNSFGPGMTELGEFTIQGNGTPGLVVSCSDPRIAEFLCAGSGMTTIAIARETAGDVGGHVHSFHSRESVGGTGPRLLLTEASTHVIDTPPSGGRSIKLSAAPNPFNPVTSIRFELDSQSFVGLLIYDVRGRLVRTLLQQSRLAGDHQVFWDGRTDAGYPLPSGIYFTSLEAGGKVETRKITLVR